MKAYIIEIENFSLAIQIALVSCAYTNNTQA